jgi:anti-anti-sigma regulatory factor
MNYVNLKNLYGNFLQFRISIDLLTNKIDEIYNINNDNEIIVDFKNIDFISRSCADELIKVKKNYLIENKINLKFINVSDEVNNIFHTVEKTQNVKKTKLTYDIPVSQYNETELFNFLNTKLEIV